MVTTGHPAVATGPTLPVADERTNPYVFIVGCPRSGTTLLGRMINAHPQLAMIHETRWIVRYLKMQIGLTAEHTVTPELISALFSYRWFRKLGIRREPLERLIDSTDPIPYSKFVTSLFDLYGAMHGKTLVGDKCPRYVRNLPLLHHLWPAARFVHLLRDGRDVCLSIVNWTSANRILGAFPTWATDPVSTAAVWWEWHVRLGRESADTLGPNLYSELRYEELVARPSAICGQICYFLDVAYSDSMLDYHEGRVRKDPGLDAKEAWLPPIAGLRDWRLQMQVDDLQRVEAVVGDLLEELGYPRASGRLTAPTRQHAKAVREQFAKYVGSRGHRLPERWNP